MGKMGSTGKATLRDMLKLIAPEHDFSSPPEWSPDVFGIATYACRLLGAYKRVVQHPWPTSDDWSSQMSRFAKKWSDHYTGNGSNKKFSNKLLSDNWKILVEALDKPLDGGQDSLRESNDDNVEYNKKLYAALVTLVVLSDEASQDLIDIATAKSEKAKQNVDLYLELNRSLFGSKAVGTWAKILDSSLIRVLPKNKTPLTGLSERSISQHLCIWTGLEVEPRFQRIDNTNLDRLMSRNSRGSSMYIALAPWPIKISKSQFQEVKETVNELTEDHKQNELAEGYKHFEFKHSKNDGELLGYLESLIEQAESKVGRVDSIILPEGAVSCDGMKVVDSYLKTRIPISIAGVVGQNLNQVHVLADLKNTDDAYLVDSQAKHHRWRIERNQIMSYGLGSQLDLDIEWWESNKLDKRELIFNQLGNELLVTTLVCEDLARQDPVSQLIRSVGANLVVAVLMDGPQFSRRWSGRYATILSEDPGCSVLTLTSAGMVDLYRKVNGKKVPRIIGLWSDPINGTQEITLDRGSLGILLKVDLQDHLQNTADGRPAVKRLTPVLDQTFQL